MDYNTALKLDYIGHNLKYIAIKEFLLLKKLLKLLPLNMTEQSLPWRNNNNKNKKRMTRLKEGQERC